MLHSLLRTLQSIFVRPEPTVQPEVKPFKIEHEWPFPSPKPTNEGYLVGELIKHIDVEGDHVFFFWGGEKRRHIRTPDGKETMLARNIIWWMEGRKVPITSAGTSLTTNCGEPKCVKLSHLTLKVRNIQHGPENRKIPVANVVPSSKQPPLPPKAKPQRTPLAKFTLEDRNHCVTRKGWFKTKEEADAYAREVNRPENRGTEPRQYSYPCESCDGFHLSKTKHETYLKKKKNKRRKVSW